MSSYYGFPAQNAQFASYMAAAAAASQTANLSGSTSTQAYQVAYPAPNQYNPQYTAMYSAAPIKTVTVVTSTSAVKPVQRAQGLYSNFVQAGQSSSSSGNGYDAAVLSAATNYTSGAASSEANPYPNYGYGTSSQSGSHASRGGTAGRRGGFWGKRTTAAGGPVARASIYYCECCKISCAGPQTWQEHIAGSKHKKREASLQSGKDTVIPARAGTSFLKCAVCEITVTGSDAFLAHVNGAKHQKTIKVYQQMGKPVPSSEPIVVTPAQAAQTNISAAEKKGTLDKKIIGRVSGKGSTVLGTAKVAFVPAGQLHTIGAEGEAASQADVAVTETTAAQPVAADSKETQPQQQQTRASTLYLPNEPNIAPVGAEYVEDVFGETGKLVSFKCKLCDCSFNDLFAKDMHLKGRRHRLAYKQKVDPTLNVEMKNNSYKNKRANAKAAGANRYFNAQKGGMARHSPGGFDPYYSMGGSHLRPLFSPHQQSFGTSELDDRYVISKHSVVYASQLELQAIQKLVLRSECALKMTSDQLLEEEVKKERERQESTVTAIDGKEVSVPVKWTPTQQQIQQLRQLRGVQRCGPLAKGLLIRGDSNVDLVVMCFEKPTSSLLNKVATSLRANIASATSGTSSAETSLPQGDVELSDFQVVEVPQEAMILVSTVAKFPNVDNPNANATTPQQSPVQVSQRRFECRVYFTSQTLGDETADAATDPSDMLPRSHCLQSLAELRHAKFFQAKISPNTEAMIALRILRDLSRRVPTWNPFPQWALELLIEKCAATAAVCLTAAQLLRRVFECIAAGILLPGGPGIFDPCERQPADAASALNEQQREDITASAQHALRLVAFGLIWKVLGVERVSQLSQLTPQRSGKKRKALDDPSPIGAKAAAVSAEQETTPMA